MTPEQHEQFSAACTAFGDALEKIFKTEAPMSEEISICGIKIRHNAAIPDDTMVILGEHEAYISKGFPKPDEEGMLRLIKIPKIDLLENLDIRFYEPPDLVETVLGRRLSKSFL